MNLRSSANATPRMAGPEFGKKDKVAPGMAYTTYEILITASPYQDGSTHIVMSPLEFMQRLAALVPRPRLNLIRFHGRYIQGSLV